MSFLGDALASSRRLGDSFTRQAELQTKGTMSALAMTGAGVGTLGNLSKQTGIAQLQEQYRHNMGWPYAIIRTIRNRICGQELKVARKVSQVEQRRLDRWSLMEKDSRQYRRYRRHLLRRPDLRTIPDGLKSYHGSLELLDDHPIVSLIRRPNPIMTRGTLMSMTVDSLELTGRAYWWFYEVNQADLASGQRWGRRYQLWPIPASWIEPRHKELDLYAEWEVRPPGIGSSIVVPGKDIGYMYYADPANPLGSISPLQAAARAVVADEAIAEAQRRGFAQGIFPGHAIVVGRHPDVQGVPGQRPILDKVQRASLIAAIKQAYRGVQNEGEPIILDGLIEDVKPITNSPRDMDFMESGKFTKERIAQTWGVNPVSMGHLEGANRASSATADDHLCNNVINPRLAMMSEILTQWLPPLFGEDPDDMLVYFEAARSYDPDLERENDQMLYDRGAISRDELRAKYGYRPVVNGKIAYIPSKLTAVAVEEDPNTVTHQGT